MNYLPSEEETLAFLVGWKPKTHKTSSHEEEPEKILYTNSFQVSLNILKEKRNQLTQWGQNGHFMGKMERENLSQIHWVYFE